MAKNMVKLKWSYGNTSHTTRLVLDMPENASDDSPVVILLHGNKGTIDHMANPAVSPKWNAEHIRGSQGLRDRGWNHYPGVGAWSVGIDPDVPVQGWAPFLLSANIPTINYQQIDPAGRLPRPAAQLKALLTALMEEGNDAGQYPELQPFSKRPVVLLGHSRGGILARQVLVNLAAEESPVLKGITTCIMLHSPNRGSSLANILKFLGMDLRKSDQAEAEKGYISNTRKTETEIKTKESEDYLIGEVTSSSYHDICVGSPTLAAIAAQEPVEGIDYFTFGGTRAILWNFRAWVFSSMSSVPQFHWPTFHWETFYLPITQFPPLIAGTWALELLNGFGDVLTTELTTRLPFSFHQINHINHSEALWDPALKDQVLRILTVPRVKQTRIVDYVIADSKDADRSIDAFGGTDPAGESWEISLHDALTYMERGEDLLIRGHDGELFKLQIVRRKDGVRYIRTRPGTRAPRLSDLTRRQRATSEPKPLTGQKEPLTV